ncbi:MAG: efflux transporter outer membrane subunit, partial [Desulfobacterales bacterium]|nr:efflux transporter outer membrane subunit [Desulfobacterales bacterium]
QHGAVNEITGFLKTAIAVLLVSAAAGCAWIGPDYSRPDTGAEIPEHYLAGKKAETEEYVPQHGWWKKFGDPELNRVVSEVVENNPDIAGAAAGVMEARAAMEQTGADRFPSLDLNVQASRQWQTVRDPLTDDKETVETDTFSLTLPASFELDLWGRLARASQAARADLLAAEENRRTVVQSMIAETVSLYLQIRFLEKQIDITRGLVASYKKNLELVEGRYRRGITPVLDVHQARRALARAEAELPSLVESKGKALHSLSILQGKYPENVDPPGKDRQALKMPPPVPAGLPSELLERRPDIRSAEASLEAACARIGAARANRFPRISLTGSLGYASNELDTLFDPVNELWKLAAGAMQPVFDAGKRAAAEEAARARYKKQVASYAKTVLQAFSEVEDALLARQQLMERHKRLVRLVSESAATLESARGRYRKGLTSYLNVLDAMQALHQAELDLAKGEYALFSNRVKLHRALGGGWDQTD